MDAAGNISEKKSIVIDKIETTKPTCSLKVVEGMLTGESEPILS